MSLAIVFPGQGAQSVGMLDQLASISDVIQKTFAEASDALGYDLWDLCQNGPAEQLDDTVYTQPAILSASIAVYRLLQIAAFTPGGNEAQSQLVTPAVMAGHSLGEYSALCAAGAMELGPAVSLVQERGRLMKQAVAGLETGMSAILGLDGDLVDEICREVSGKLADNAVVAAVNFNCPGQVVVAGTKAAVDAASEKLKAAGAKRIVALPVSVPSHCLLMKPAADALAEAISTTVTAMPSVPVLQNVDGKPAVNLEQLQDRLVRQLHEPVQWQRCMEGFSSYDTDLIYECGPGSVLAGLGRKIDRNMKVASLSKVSEWSFG